MKNKEQPTKLLLWHVNDSCNLSCDYCVTAQERKRKDVSCSSVDTEKLKTFLDRTKETYFIIFTGGGEPFLSPNIIEAAEIITKEHYLGLNTNLTSSRVKEFCEKIDPNKIRHIIASLHIEEIGRKLLTERFVENYKLCKEKGFKIDARTVAHPKDIWKVNDYRRYFEKRGVEILFDPFIGEYNGKEYPKSYTKEELKILNIPTDEIKKFYTKREYCNAGYNAASVNSKGDVSVCLDLIGVRLGNIYEGFEFRKTCIKCPLDLCTCPLYDIDKNLLEVAMKHKPKRYSFEIDFSVKKDRLDRRLGMIGPKIRRLSPTTYNTLKKMELKIRGK